MTMADRRLTGLVLKTGPLGEHDRLLTLLSAEAGVIRLAVPGARRPRSSHSMPPRNHALRRWST